MQSASLSPHFSLFPESINRRCPTNIHRTMIFSGRDQPEIVAINPICAIMRLFGFTQQHVVCLSVHATDITEMPEAVARQPACIRCSSDEALSIVVEMYRVVITRLASGRARFRRCAAWPSQRESMSGRRRRISVSLTPNTVIIAVQLLGRNWR